MHHAEIITHYALRRYVNLRDASCVIGYALCMLCAMHYALTFDDAFSVSQFTF